MNKQIYETSIDYDLLWELANRGYEIICFNGQYNNIWHTLKGNNDIAIFICIYKSKLY